MRKLFGHSALDNIHVGILETASSTPSLMSSRICSALLSTLKLARDWNRWRIFFGNTIRFDDEGYPAPDNMEQFHANFFQDFGRGFLFLLRAATGKEWNSCIIAFHDKVTRPCQ
ncbi:hypothetical protein PsorP6_000206 [Peronosclerospora sorghi]|uniref:Uncharacterized protein n=1 Tax=Peronosclerospora sorghi TaxID=230839 RepID=A0ACC0WTP9_9STRA|nr:hypothetical protein PsorP6_000206 [Peronosclerospora sorghi]